MNTGEHTIMLCCLIIKSYWGGAAASHHSTIKLFISLMFLIMEGVTGFDFAFMQAILISPLRWLPNPIFQLSPPNWSLLR